jgi:hypothetical protein
MASVSWADPFSKGNTSAGESFEGGKDPYKIAPEPVSGNSLTQRLRSLMNVGGNWAQELNTGGTSNVGAATDYWGKILSGNRAAMMEGLAPEVKSIQGQYANVAKANSMLAPRGGGRATVAAEAPYSMASAIQSLLQSVRPQAANAMSQIGLQQLGLSQQELSTILQAALGMRGQDLTERGQNMGLGSSLGTGIAKLVPWDKIFPSS